MGLTKDEEVLLVLLERQIVEHSGMVHTACMKAADFATARRWAQGGFIAFGRRPIADIQKERHISGRSYWVRFSPSAWETAHQLRRQRAERNVPTIYPAQPTVAGAGEGS